MGTIDTFLNASQQTRNIILAVNCIFLAYYLVALADSNRIRAYGVAAVAILAGFFVVRFYSGVGPKTYITYYHAPALLLFMASLGTYHGVRRLIPEKAMGIFDVRIPTSKGPMTVNILKGVSVQGAAGSGKTISIAGWILHYMGQRSVPGLIYDYKDFEFTEIVLWSYRNSEIPVNIFAPADPKKSVHLNILDPSIFGNREDVLLMSKCIVGSVLGEEAKKQGSFFVQAAEGAITGCIIKLLEDRPELCTFPHLVAIFLSKDVDDLVGFIESNPNAARQARAFLDSAGSSKQMAGVKASLSNAFRQFDVPGIFYCMQRREVGMALNDPADPSVLCLVNKPKYGDVYEPLFAMVAQACILEMGQRARKESYILLDEAPTVRVPKVERLPATMRSFGIATIYMLQDKVQAANRLGEGTMKEILANLSTIFFGKTNDPDTAKLFESYAGEVKTKQHSISRKSGALFEGGDARVTTSERDEKRHKSFEMYKRSTGQFFVFDEKGNSYDANIKKPVIEPISVKDNRSVTEHDLKNHYEHVFRIVREL